MIISFTVQLLATAALAAVGGAMALFGFCSSRPPTPPAPSAERKTEPVYKGITKVMSFTQSNARYKVV